MPRTVRIAILDDYQGVAERYFATDLIEEVCEPDITIYRDHADSSEELIRRTGAHEVVVAMRERSPFPARVIDQLAETKLIVTTGARNAAIDVVAARRRGITVCGAGATDSATAELAWGLILAVVRRIPGEDAGVRAGRWGVHVGDTLAGKTLGVIGLGNIGRQVARYGLAFGMQVVASGRSLTREMAALVGCEAASTETVLRQADVVSVHLRLTDETRGSIGWREFGYMKPSAYFVNTARGALVDEQALLDALIGGKIRGAALDVHATEPLPQDSPFLALDNVVLTPHIGYVSSDRYRSYYGQAAEAVAYYLRGRPIGVIG